jgi:hypothetical protein
MTHFENDLDRFRQQLEEDDGSAPTLWDPKEGDWLVAELVRYEKRNTRIGEAVVVVVRDIDTGALSSIFLTRSVLKNAFNRQSPRPGDIVGVKFHGEKPTRNGDRSYMDYTLNVRRALGSESPPQMITTAPPAPPPASTPLPSTTDDELPW